MPESKNISDKRTSEGTKAAPGRIQSIRDSLEELRRDENEMRRQVDPKGGKP